MLGDHHPTIYLWCSLAFTSLGSGLNWGGAGTSVLHLADTHTQGMPVSDVIRRSQLQCRTCDCLCCSVTLHEGMSVMIWCTTLWGSSSHLSLIFLFPWKASAFTKTRSPGFRSTTPIFQLQYCFCLWVSTVDWTWASCRVVLHQSQTVATYLSTHLAEAPLLQASVLLKVGK